MDLYVLDLIGVGVFAVSGAIAAGRKSLDILGVLVIAVVTAIGGGTLRDLLLDRHPIFWIADTTYLTVIAISAGMAVVYIRLHRPPGKSLLIADAFGLAVFTIIGAQAAEAVDLPPMLVVLMGTMTGVVGGILRDVLCAEVPLILRRDIYATAAIVGALCYYFVQEAELGQEIAVYVGMAVVLLLRLLAIFRGLRLPVFRLPQEPS